MSTINVLELCEAYGGGVKRQVDYLNDYVSDKEYKLITLVSSKRTNTVHDGYIINNDLSSYKNPIKFIINLNLINKLVNENNINLIHAHSTVAGILAMLYKVFFLHKGIKVVYTPHAYYSEISRGKLKDTIIVAIERFMNTFFSKIIHVSSEEEKYAIDKKLVSKRKSIVINNGVPELKKDERNHYGKVFINVARCDYQKNPMLFLKISKIIVENIPDSKFIWVGDGPLLDDCMVKVKKWNLEKKIQFIGYSDNPYSQLDKADFFISTSKYEGLPFSVLEALAFKMPVLLTNIIGHNELVMNNGFLFDEDISEEELLKKVQQLIQNARIYSKNSFKLYKKNYSVRKMVDKIQKIYSNIGN